MATPLQRVRSRQAALEIEGRVQRHSQEWLCRLHADELQKLFTLHCCLGPRRTRDQLLTALTPVYERMRKNHE